MLVGYIALDNYFEQRIENAPDFGTLRNAYIDEVATINGKIFDAEDGLGVELLVHELFRLGKRHAHGVVGWLLVSEANLVAMAYGEELLRVPVLRVSRESDAWPSRYRVCETCDGRRDA